MVLASRVSGIEPFVPYLRERVMAYPGLTGRRLWRELRERGYRGGYTAVTDQLRQLRPAEHTRSKAPINAPIHQFRHSGTAPAVIILP